MAIKLISAQQSWSSADIGLELSLATWASTSSYQFLSDILKCCATFLKFRCRILWLVLSTINSKAWNHVVGITNCEMVLKAWKLKKVKTLFPVLPHFEMSVLSNYWIAMTWPKARCKISFSSIFSLDICGKKILGL